MRVSFDHSHDESLNAGERMVDATFALVHRGSSWGMKYATLVIPCLANILVTLLRNTWLRRSTLSSSTVYILISKTRSSSCA